MTLYRTYRPQRFRDLINQDTASSTLQRGLFLGRVAHAYLFSGPRGTGKTSTARIFARALACTNPAKKDHDGSIAYEPCNKCDSCVSILENHTPDFVEIDAASNRGIENIRQLREEVQYRPIQLSRKVYIIDEVHMLSGDAFNALLKTLEEPPEYCLFILATTEINKVPITVRSRCQLVRFERGSLKAIEKKLDAIVKAEDVEVEKGVTALLAEHAEGGFRDAETLLEAYITQFQPLTLEATRAGLGILPAEVVDELLTAILTGSQTTAANLLNAHFSQSSGTLERIISQIINRLRDELYAAQTGGKRTISAAIPAKLLVFALDQLLTAYILQRSSPLPSLPLEIACFTICDEVGKSDQTPRIVAAPQSESNVPVASMPINQLISIKPVPVAQAPTATAPVIEISQEPVSDVRKAWKMTIEAIGAENMILSQAMRQTVFHTAERGIVTILVRFKFHADKMGEKKNKVRISQLMEDFTGTPWEIEYTINGNMPKAHLTKKLESAIDDVTAVFGS
jgi:DNA polymerase-3 subunit gamma/tau